MVFPAPFGPTRAILSPLSHREVHIRKERLGEALTQMLSLHDERSAGTARKAEAGLPLIPLGGVDHGRFIAPQSSLHSLRPPVELCILPSPALHLLCRRGEACLLPLLVRPRRALDPPLFELGLTVGGRISVGHPENAPGDLGRPVAGAIEEGAIVGDDEGGTRVACQVTLQPAPHLHIEVIGRLIEEEKIGLAHEQTGQAESGLLPAREAGNRLLLPPLEAERVEDGVPARAALVAPAPLEAGVEPLPHPVARGVVKTGGLDLAEPPLESDQFGERPRGQLLEGDLRGEGGILLEPTDEGVIASEDGATIALLYAREQP